MQRLWAMIAAAFLLNLVACAQRAPAPRASVAAPQTSTPLPPPPATPTPMLASTPTSTPQSSPVTQTTAAPSPQVTPTATPSATPQPLMVASNARPQIVAVNISSQTVHGGDTISGTVVTSSNVASVEARIATFSIPVPKVSTGRFVLNYVVPNVPFFFHGTYPMTVIARNTAGDAVQRVIQITVE
jgi:hypothetical protein